MLELSKTDNGVRDLMHNCDVIVDGPFIQEEHEPGLLFKGSRNQRIINVVESLKQNRIVLMNITKK